ncbi:MAG: hypothetical protein PHY34_06165 [Patescibacteria group bacterium]|nr:hypothetical protein [Patescibacteria group bacterium]MDD5715781.1 hypothetical protein [Patescibacteria group bacterium]
MSEYEQEHNPEKEPVPSTLYHGTTATAVEEFEPRRRSIPGGADPETQPKLIYASDNPAFSAAHAFLWGSNEGFELSVEKDGVLFRVPVDQQERLNVPVHVYTMPGGNFTLTSGEGTGHTYQTDRPTKPAAVESFATVKEAIEHFGGRVEFYDKKDG